MIYFKTIRSNPPQPNLGYIYEVDQQNSNSILKKYRVFIIILTVLSILSYLSYVNAIRLMFITTNIIGLVNIYESFKSVFSSSKYYSNVITSTIKLHPSSELILLAIELLCDTGAN